MESMLWVDEILEHGTTLVVGAGISLSSPTCLKSAIDLAGEVKQNLLSNSAFESVVSGVPDGDLQALADAVQAHSAPALAVMQHRIVQSGSFLDAEPNYSHLVLALLLQEGVVDVITLNWDRCIERAASRHYGTVEGCCTDEQLTSVLNTARLLKPHGSAEIPNSLRVSSQQMAEAPWWAQHATAAGLATNRVTFIGVSDPPTYIRPTLQKIVELAAGPSVKVVGPSEPPAWTAMLEGEAGDWFIQGTSDEILDELIRGLTQKQIEQAQVAMREAAESIVGFDSDQPLNEIYDLIRDQPAHVIWLWARRGMTKNSATKLATGSTLVNCLLALVMLHQVIPISTIAVFGPCVTVVSDEFTIELALASDVVSSDALMRQKVNSLKARRAENLIPKNKPCLVLASGYVGALPRPGLPDSVVDSADADSVIDGPTVIDDRWVGLEEVIRVRGVDDLRALIGIAS